MFYRLNDKYIVAVESSNGNGVGWFSPSLDFLGVEFDDVQKDNDRQKLSFSNGGEISIEVKNGKVKILELINPDKKEIASDKYNCLCQNATTVPFQHSVIPAKI